MPSFYVHCSQLLGTQLDVVYPLDVTLPVGLNRKAHFTKFTWEALLYMPDGDMPNGLRFVTFPMITFPAHISLSVRQFKEQTLRI